MTMAIPRGAFGHISGLPIPCGRCGRHDPPGRGTFDWLGRYLCQDCHEAQAAATEATRLAAVEAEVLERAAMWCLPPLAGA
jgi:hypothetical protein